MFIDNLIKEYKQNFDFGIFELKQNQIINDIVKINKVPDKYGVYIIYGIKNNYEEIIYIGKSGTMENKGIFKNQGIKTRLTKKQDGVYRKVYFQNIMKKYQFDKLKFLWIITFDDKNKELPFFVEAKMIQAYFNMYDKLPLLNKSV